MNTDRNAVAVVRHANIAVRKERDLYVVTAARHRFIARIIKYLPDEMVETLGTRGSNVHPRAFAHRLKALKDRNRRGIIGLLFRLFFGRFDHTAVPSILA